MQLWSALPYFRSKVTITTETLWYITYYSTNITGQWWNILILQEEDSNKLAQWIIVSTWQSKWYIDSNGEYVLYLVDYNCTV